MIFPTRTIEVVDTFFFKDHPEIVEQMQESLPNTRLHIMDSPLFWIGDTDFIEASTVILDFGQTTENPLEVLVGIRTELESRLHEWQEAYLFSIVSFGVIVDPRTFRSTMRYKFRGYFK